MAIEAVRKRWVLYVFAAALLGGIGWECQFAIWAAVMGRGWRHVFVGDLSGVDGRQHRISVYEQPSQSIPGISYCVAYVDFWQRSGIEVGNRAWLDEGAVGIRRSDRGDHLVVRIVTDGGGRWEQVYVIGASGLREVGARW